MIRAALGVMAAIAAMAVVIFVVSRIPDRIWVPAISVILGCFAAGYIGTLVGRTWWSGWVPVGLLFAFIIVMVLYAYFERAGIIRFVSWWRIIGIPLGIIVACWLGMKLASRFIPDRDQEALENLQRAFE